MKTFPTSPATPQEARLRELTCRQYKNGAWRDFTDIVTPEYPVYLQWPDAPTRELLTFPEGCDRLALGHALLELCAPGEHPAITATDGDTYTLAPIAAPAAPQPPTLSPIPAETILDCMKRFIAGEGRWEATGCFHRAAVWDPASGEFITQAEDIGRHNCIDRLAGWSVEKDRPLAGLMLFVSARATTSLVRKAVQAGFSAMVSRSAVTTSGVATAREAGMTLAGFAREIRFTVFTDPRGRFDDPARRKG